MTGSGSLEKLEQWMTYIRWFAIVFGVIAISVTPDFPDRATETEAWIVVVLLAIGSLVIWGALARIEGAVAMARLGAIAFAFDGLVIAALVWIFAYEDPYVTWALLFLVPMEGALRYRMKGAIGGAGAVAVFFLFQMFRRSSITGDDLDYTTYIFVIGLSGLIAGVVGSMAENWYRQSIELERQRQKLAEVDRLKDRFLAVTSHELRGPLTAIIGGVHTLNKRQDRLTPEQRNTLMEMVSSQAEQLARLVDDIRVTSQLQAHQLTLMPEWTDLETTVANALEAAQIKRRHHRLEVFIDPLRIQIDAARVGQIIRNLVENAYKYTPENTRVAITARTVPDGVEIAVEDDGPGIPADKRNLLFEAFSRIEETAAGQEGMGLGLYVVSQLVSAMGGRIDLASSSRGTTFAIYIPCPTQQAGRPPLGLVAEDHTGA